MSVQLSKAIMCAAMEVQTRGQAPPPLLPSQATISEAESVSSSEYRKCRKRIRALEAAVEELRQELGTKRQGAPA